MPSWRRLSIITRVSSLSRAPKSVEVPSASAAQTRARLVMLFEPGGRIRPRIGAVTGLISIESLIAMTRAQREGQLLLRYDKGFARRMRGTGVQGPIRLWDCTTCCD